MSRPAGKPHQVPHREKIGLVMQFVDQLAARARAAAALCPECRRDNAPRPCPGEPREMLQRRQARRAQLLGIFVAQFVERKGAAVGDLDACGQRPRGTRQTARSISSGDFRCRSALGNSRCPSSATVQPSRVAVSTSCSGWRERIVIMHVVGRHQRHAGSSGRLHQSTQAPNGRRVRDEARPASNSDRRKLRDSGSASGSIGSVAAVTGHDAGRAVRRHARPRRRT